jgi:predicted NBD/HSP70 family sugar kinase
MTRSALPPAAFLGLGVGVRDTVDPVTGITYGWPDTPGWGAAWTNFPLRDALAEIFPFPHIVVDDIARNLGLAEAHYGQGSLDIDFIYLLIDDGIGMAMMMGGAPYIGHSHIAGEIGHVPIGNKAFPCACGNVGCLQKLISSPAILSRLQLRLDQTEVRSVFRQPGAQPDIHSLITAAQEGDKLCYQLLTETGEEFGQALAMLLNLFGPALIVVGGAVSNSDIFLESARRMVKLLALERTSSDVVITRSELGALAGARGAATMALNSLFEPGEKNIFQLVQNK